ncbi:MAG: UDP-N-acetylmuramate dehydrogenase [Candidatus Omnitrophota bacterium]
MEKNWWQNLRGRAWLDEPLKNRTTFKIGGRARFFVEPKDSEDLKLLLSAVKGAMPVLVLGAGSNILIHDKGVDAVVVRLSSDFFKSVAIKGDLVSARAGASLGSLIQATALEGLSGFEFLAGIPGTLGGALVMNAGAWGRCIYEIVEKATVMDYDGKVKVLEKNKINFSYRHSDLEKYIILDVDLRLVRKEKNEIVRKVNEYLLTRKKTQDASYPNAGCVFKNPDQGSAGKLIDLCGLKGAKFGGALISRKHANFILNKKNAKCDDVLKLMDLVKREVKNRFRVNLEPEIKIWN